jgi:hypothetical protein
MIAWFKKWGTWLLAGVAAFFAGAWVLARRKRLSAEARARVAMFEKEIEGQKARRQLLLDRATEHTAEIERIDERIAEGEREIVAVHDAEVEGLSREQIRQRLRRLGY